MTASATPENYTTLTDVTRRNASVWAHGVLLGPLSVDPPLCALQSLEAARSIPGFDRDHAFLVIASRGNRCSTPLQTTAPEAL